MCKIEQSLRHVTKLYCNICLQQRSVELICLLRIQHSGSSWHTQHACFCHDRSIAQVLHGTLRHALHCLRAAPSAGIYSFTCHHQFWLFAGGTVMISCLLVVDACNVLYSSGLSVTICYSYWWVCWRPTYCKGVYMLLAML